MPVTRRDGLLPTWCHFASTHKIHDLADCRTPLHGEIVPTDNWHTAGNDRFTICQVDQLCNAQVIDWASRFFNQSGNRLCRFFCLIAKVHPLNLPPRFLDRKSKRVSPLTL